MKYFQKVGEEIVNALKGKGKFNLCIQTINTTHTHLRPHNSALVGCTVPPSLPIK